MCLATASYSCLKLPLFIPHSFLSPSLRAGLLHGLYSNSKEFIHLPMYSTECPVQNYISVEPRGNELLFFLKKISKIQYHLKRRFLWFEGSNEKVNCRVYVVSWCPHALMVGGCWCTPGVCDAKDSFAPDLH